MTGPVSTNQKSIVGEEDTGDLLYVTELPKYISCWSYSKIVFNIYPQSNLEKVFLQFVDDGSNWGSGAQFPNHLHLVFLQLHYWSLPKQQPY